ncbi:divergent polysaccharide deacetylase family protein [Candidatus Neomarinimicrobiota bacterium]
MAVIKAISPALLKAMFSLLVIGALGLIGWQVVSSRAGAGMPLGMSIAQLRNELVAEAESLGFQRSLRETSDDIIRFIYPPTTTTQDVDLAMQRLERRYGLSRLTAWISPNNRQEFNLELGMGRQGLVARFVFGPPGSDWAVEPGIKGRIGLIIDDFGYGRNATTAEFMTLEPKLTFSVIPGQRFSAMLALEAFQAGHEIMIHMPMEPEDYNGRDDADFILLYGMHPDSARARVIRAFQAIPQAIGMNNHEGSLASLDTVLLEAVANELLIRGKYFIDSYTTPNTRGLEIMQRVGVLATGRNIFIDNEDDPEYIRSQLQELAQIADREGVAIGIGHVGASHQQTLEVLRQEIPRLQREGFEFVPISVLLRDLPVPGDQLELEVADG